MTDNPIKFAAYKKSAPIFKLLIKYMKNLTFLKTVTLLTALGSYMILSPQKTQAGSSPEIVGQSVGFGTPDN